MNDFYEYKARKYKYKYLKLKREYISEGGVKATVKATKEGLVNNLTAVKKGIKKKTEAVKEGIKKKTEAVKETVKATKEGFKKKKKEIKKFFNIKIELKLMSEKEKSKPIDHTQPASDEQKNFKKNLILLKSEIERVIKPLYEKNEILGNMDFYNIFYEGEKIIFYNYDIIKIIISNNITFKFNNKKSIKIITYNNKEETCLKYSEYFRSIQILFDDYQKIVRFERFMIPMLEIIKPNYPPILIWFKQIFETKYEATKEYRLDMYYKAVKDYGKTVADINSGHLKIYLKGDNSITKYELLKALETNQQSLPEKVIKEFKKDFECFSNKNHPDDDKKSTYNMSNIFGYCIMTKQYLKNIDYYLLTMIICKLYETYTLYLKIVEDTTKKLPRLPQLFKNFKDEIKNHSIDEISFFNNLNKIISVIKD